MDHEATITEQELERMLFDESAEPKALPLSLLGRITNGFSYRMEIGRGGFAVVYKAMLNNGAVAVKRLSNTYMYENEFLREIECLMKVKHKNIVRFLGYCVDTQGNMAMYEGKFVLADIQQRLLCFEYLPNGGLNGYITDPSCGLEWRDRYNIIKGICEGLHHLHQRNIVHLDLKPANILLDECMKPKISDFGISRCFAEDQTRIIASKVVGTTGYMAPEFVSHVITQKYDLYSLGVIIMEILIGDKGRQSVDNVVKSWSNRLGVSEMTSQCEQIQVCAEIGIECIDFDPANRPVSVKHIIERLVETERMEGSSQIAPVFNILDTDITHNRMCSLDTNHAKQWIITGEEKGHVRIWNYKTQKKIYSFRLSESSPVKLVKFIERKQWFAAGAHYYYSSIHVYSYETIMQKIMSISVAELGSLMSLAVHPTKPYLLSVHHQWHTIIWNWDKNWQRTEILGGDWLEKCQSAFSSQDTVAIPSSRGTVKVLSLDSPESNYTLSGHSERVNCLIFFTRDDQEYLVTGSDDLTAKIWDMQKKICLNTLRCMSAVMSILYRPDLQILITGSKNGDVHLWRTAGCRTYSRYPRLKGTVNIGHGVHSLACLMGRVLVGKKDGVVVMDIDNVCYGEESTYYSEPELREDMKPTNDGTSKVIAGSSSELPTLDVHPLELCFPYAPNMSICCPLELTNTTNERAAFRLMDKSAKTELYDIVPPKSTYTLIVTREENSSMKLVGETEFHLLLQSCTLGDRYIVMFTSQSECDDFFEEAQELGNNVHEVTLKCVYVPQGDLMFKALLVSRGIKIISVKSTDEELCSIYAHPTEGWIITGHANGDVRSWKHGMKLPGRTDNEIKNFWNTRSKRRAKAGLGLYPDGLLSRVQNQDMDSHSPDDLHGKKRPNELSQGNGLVFDDIIFEKLDYKKRAENFLAPPSMIQDSLPLDAMNQLKRHASSDMVSGYGASPRCELFPHEPEKICYTNICLKNQSVPFNNAIANGPPIFSTSGTIQRPIKMEPPSFQNTNYELSYPVTPLCDNLISSPASVLTKPDYFPSQNNGLLDAMVQQGHVPGYEASVPPVVYFSSHPSVLDDNVFEDGPFNEFRTSKSSASLDAFWADSHLLPLIDHCINDGSTKAGNLNEGSPHSEYQPINQSMKVMFYGNYCDEVQLLAPGDGHSLELESVPWNSMPGACHLSESSNVSQQQL